MDIYIINDPNQSSLTAPVILVPKMFFAPQCFPLLIMTYTSPFVKNGGL